MTKILQKSKKYLPSLKNNIRINLYQKPYRCGMALNSLLKDCVQSLLDQPNIKEKDYGLFIEFISTGITNEALAEIKQLIEFKKDTAMSKLLYGIICYHRYKNYALALKSFEEARDKGSVRAEVWIGAVYNTRSFVNYDPKIVEQHLQTAVAQGDIWGRLSLLTLTNKDDTEEGRQIFKEAISKKEFQGYVGLLNSYNRTHEHTKITEMCEQALAIDEAQPLFASGVAFSTIKYGIFNPAKALEYMTRAAEKNWPSALHTLGLYHQNGQFGSVDGKLALKYYLQLLDLGSTLPLFDMGRLHAEALCCSSKDYDTLYMYSLLAVQNRASNREFAYCSLGMCYLNGLGDTPQNSALAVRNFNKSLRLLEKQNSKPSRIVLKNILEGVYTLAPLLKERCLALIKKWAAKGEMEYLVFLSKTYQKILDLLNEDFLKKLLKPQSDLASYFKKWQDKFPIVNIFPTYKVGALTLTFECIFLQKLEHYTKGPVNFEDTQSAKYFLAPQTRFIKKHFKERINEWLITACYSRLVDFIRTGEGLKVILSTPENKKKYEDIVWNAQGIEAMLQNMVQLTGDEEIKSIMKDMNFSVEPKLELHLYKSLDSKEKTSTSSAESKSTLESSTAELSLESKPDANKNTPPTSKRLQPS